MGATAQPDDSTAEPLLSPEDLEAFATIDPVKAGEMITDALSIATVVAPCLSDPNLAPDKRNAAKAILRGAVLRWNEAGTGAAQTRISGPFQQMLDTRQTRRSMFWPTEIDQLQQLCRTTSAGAYSISPSTAGAGGHAAICSVFFGGDCSCGYVLTQLFPLYERDC